MKQILVNEQDIVNAAQQGCDEFIDLFVNAIYEAVGGEINQQAITSLNADQITLLAYVILRDEVMDGGFVQLIHNGYGEFIFKNPFSKMMRLWGIDELAKMINKVHKLYSHHHEQIEAECSDEEFMALFEKLPEFDDYDDCFVENEEEWTESVAHYVDQNLDKFVKVVK